jgi:predicted SnoaL-like aldol condensation-catalyzing enzyme
MRIGWISAAAILLGLPGCTTVAQEDGLASTPCDGSAESNRRVVLAFYEEALVGLKPGPAFERYMSPGFVEHKPDVPEGTRAATAAYLESLIQAMPAPRWEVIRTVAEGEFVFLHARFSPAAQAPPYAIADVFRLRDCKIVEHWDVVGPPPEQQRNPNGRF